MNQKKLLEGLEGPGISITVRSLAKYMASNGVLATPHIGRCRGYISLSSKAFGIKLDKMSEKGGTFYKERASEGHLCFIPREDEAELTSLENRLRRAVEARTLAEGFMPMVAYESLKEEFESIRSDYFTKRDEICSNWPALVDAFQDGAAEMLKGIRMPNRTRIQLLKEFMAELPDVESYRRSFTMSLRVHAFPAEVSMDGLNSSIAADVQATWQEEVVSTAILSIEKLVGESWQKLLNAIKQYLKGATIKSSSINAMVKLGKELEWKNPFRNPLLSEMSAVMKDMGAKNTEDQVDAIETAITAVYGYAKEAGLDLDMDKCPYTIDQLEDMLLVETSMNQKLKGA